MDYALGEYLKRASKSEYFKNTVFMLLGDNGAAGRNPKMSAVEERLGLQFFHTPLVIYAPGAGLAGEVRTVPGSQYDLVPTAAGAAGLALENRTLGRNLLDARFDDRRLAFMEIPVGAGMHSVVVGEEYCLHVHPDGGAERLYRFAGSRLDDLSAQQPADAQRLREMALGIFHTARYMLYNNTPGAGEMRVFLRNALYTLLVVGLVAATQAFLMSSRLHRGGADRRPAPAPRHRAGLRHGPAGRRPPVLRDEAHQGQDARRVARDDNPTGAICSRCSSRSRRRSRTRTPAA